MEKSEYSFDLLCSALLQQMAYKVNSVQTVVSNAMENLIEIISNYFNPLNTQLKTREDTNKDNDEKEGIENEQHTY